MITEIFIENNRLDISADISSLLTFAIDDVKDFASRQTAFSKTIVLPGTANNNALFGNIFDVGSSNVHDSSLPNIAYNFNASKSAKCLAFQNNIQSFKGSLRLLEIINYRGGIEYEVAIFGEIAQLNVALSSALLEDLDFSAYDETWDEVNIVASWDNPGGSGVYYPLIDHGTYSTGKHDWDFRTMRPALYVKEYIDKMFEAANYRYTCSLFDTARFKSLIIPHNQKVLLSLTSRALYATLSTSQLMLDSSNGITTKKPNWTDITAGGFTYASGVFTYTQPSTISGTARVSIGGTRYSLTAGSFTIKLRVNGVAIATHTEPTFPTPGSGYRWNEDIPITIATSDTVDVQFDYVSGTEQLVTVLNSSIEIISSTPNYQPVDYGQDITMNDAIPKNIRQVDFLTSIVKLFNLYVYENQFDDRHILMGPFVDFYSTDSGNAVDWTYKLNRDQAVKIKPMSELNSKIYKFKYKDDTDYYNDLYKKRYNEGYGSYTFDSLFEFATQESSLELIFAGTPLVGYVGEEKVYSTIFKKSGTTEETIDSVIRILQTKKVTGVASWDILDGVSVLDSVTDYGYAGHFDDPDNVGNDLNFGVLKELFFVLVTGDLTVTQFNLYWSSYMAEITDKDSKLITGKFYLTPKDIFSLDFSKYVYLDGNIFRLNKITDYNLTIPNDCEVQLLRVINTLY